LGPPEILGWDGRTATTALQFACSGQIYEPTFIHPSILSRTHLPTHAAPYGSAKKLFDEIGNAFLANFNLTDASAALLTASAISSWFATCFAVAPCLSIATSTTSEAVRVLRFLSCFCYHPLRLGALSRNDLLNLPMQLHPTLLINGTGLNKGAHTLLNVSNHRGIFVQKDGSLVDLYCAKVVAGVHQATFLEGALHVSIDPPQLIQTSPFDDDAEEELARRFQPRLLRYRLENWDQVARSLFDAPAFISPTREIARTLGMCLVDEELQKNISALLLDRDRELRGNRSLDFPATVIEALLAFCHENGTTSVHVKDITLGARAILEARGENAELSYESVGLILKNLGLHTAKLDRNGKGLELREETRKRIHHLALQYDIETAASKGVRLCQYCTGDGCSK
jgi:hypothetical protein